MNLYEKRRFLTEEELSEIPWLAQIKQEHAKKVKASLCISEADEGEIVCKIGAGAKAWLGLTEGLLKMSTDTKSGQSITYSGLTAGGWFGEGTLIKKENYKYNVQALRKSKLVGLPSEVFFWLLDNSIEFNRFLINQLNARLAHFISTIESDRATQPEQKVARSLALLASSSDPAGQKQTKVKITQQELAYLVGLSRQRVNEALSQLAKEKLIMLSYGEIKITDPEKLKQKIF